MAGVALQQVVEQQVLAVAKAVEDHIDDELNRLERFDEDDLDKLRQRRLQEMKSQAAKRSEWLSRGHGEYTEIEEKGFFKEVKASERVVCHFYRENWPCKVMDKHLTVLAKDHVETKFLRINAEKSPFLCERLKIFMLPTLAIIKNGKTEDYVVGFDELGGSDDFSTQTLEGRLGSTGVINWDGEKAAPKGSGSQQQRSVRQTTYDSDDD
eukprot:TRINITY_DN22336_c0_g1_i1.p1 TRINITY_DN22336_c0_g1~~TRINITY_DN22336_c0_g1_i1.p1  ORF type:complete len:210 (-),score=62.82 TRINITY_DN22336_c0_g1_i1:734-1363(-)